MRCVSVVAGWVVLVVVSFACGAPQPTPQPLALRSLGPPVAATLGRDGGALQVEANGYALRLEVPATALSADPPLTLEPVAVDGLEGLPAVRFGPAGQAFALPATLVVSPPPPGGRLVALHFEEGAATGTLRGVAPLGDGATMVVPHFSGAAVGPAEALRQKLDEAQQALLDGLADDREASAFGLADRLALVVEPAVGAATGRVAALVTAQQLFAPWATAVQTLGVSEETVAARGETFRDAVSRLEGSLLRAAEALLPASRCRPAAIRLARSRRSTTGSTSTRACSSSRAATGASSSAPPAPTESSR